MRKKCSKATRPIAKASAVAVIVLGTTLGCSENLTDWETFQGNSSHTAYVQATLDPNRFSLLWEWERPNKDAGIMPAINPAVIANGVIYITEDDYHSAVSMYALSETDGSILWSRDFGDIAQLNQPAVSDGKVFVTTSGHDDTFMWVFDGVSGELLGSSPFDTQWPQYLSPTIYNGVAYCNTGYYGGRTGAFDTAGVMLWESASYGDNDMFTPAVDDAGVYQYSGNALNVLDPISGDLILSINDPDPDEIGYSHIGSTIRGSMNNVISFSGDNFSGRASSSTGGYRDRRLMSFDLTQEAIAWKSESQYKTHPALANGVVFAASDAPKRLEALDEATGNILWTWVPQDTGVTGFHRNIIATNNLVFVTSNLGVHAISLQNHSEVWHYPTPGTLSLSKNKILYIAEGFRESTGKLIAIDLATAATTSE